VDPGVASANSDKATADDYDDPGDAAGGQGDRGGELTPLGDFKPSEYRAVVLELLLSEGMSDTCMICMPSFQPEYSVMIVHIDDPKCSWSVEVAAADRQIWGNRERKPDGSSEMSYRRDVHVTRRSVALDTSAGEELFYAWRAVVRRARYPRPEYAFTDQGERVEMCEGASSDGTRYLFRGGEFFGETHSPDEGLSLGIVRLADALKECAFGSPADQPSALAKCVEMAKQLRTSAENAW
jgi:hypothetical protein